MRSIKVSLKLLSQSAFKKNRQGASADFFVCQVAGGVGGPEVAGEGFGADPEVAATHAEPAAIVAAAGDVAFFVLELGQQGVGKIGPDGAEGPLPDIAERKVPPKLVGVHRAVPTNAADAPARVVPFVHLQEFQHLSGPLGIFLEQF